MFGLSHVGNIDDAFARGAQLAALDSLPSRATRPHPGRAVPCTHAASPARCAGDSAVQERVIGRGRSRFCGDVRARGLASVGLLASWVRFWRTNGRCAGIAAPRRSSSMAIVQAATMPALQASGVGLTVGETESARVGHSCDEWGGEKIRLQARFPAAGTVPVAGRRASS